MILGSRNEGQKFCFVIDEWLLHDLGNIADHERRLIAKSFLNEMLNICDRIAMIEGSAWMTKVYQLMSASNKTLREVSKYFRLQILMNSRKFTKIPRSDCSAVLSIPAGIKDDDSYLLETYSASSADLLVTSDQPLIEALRGQPNYHVIHRDEFLRLYVRKS